MEKGKKLYKPAEFAKIVGMTKRALRYYYALDLLIPAFENELGHRFYSEENFFEAQRILSLRFIGFSLEEIRDIQKSHTGMKESLKLQYDVLNEKMGQIQTILRAIEDMQNFLEQPGEIPWEEIFNAVKFAKYEMVKEKMMAYYDERAEEYEDIFVGKGPADYRPQYYAMDIEAIEKFMEGFGKGHMMDIACGSGYWLKYYYPRCSAFTFLDQSGKMLEECRHKTDQYGITDISKFVQCNILEYEAEGGTGYDCALIGFLLSHFTKAQEEIFFSKLKRLLKPGAEILIIDSTWTKVRAQKQNKEDIEERRLNDGRTFRIYKKYFDKGDLAALLNRYGITVKKDFFGHSFAAVMGVV